MRYCVVGPIHPYRGGIAQHSTLLCRHLSEKHDVGAVSFKRLYPAMLFPGKSQIDQSRKAASFQAERVIDSINPLTWRRAGRLIREWQPDFVLVEWWHPFFGPSLGSVVAGVRPSKVIFVCHNVIPHESGPMIKPLTMWALGRGDGFMVHSGEEQAALRKLIPDCRVEKTVLPGPDMFPRQGISKEQARSKLGLKGRTILFFGLVRKYKGLIDLIHAMSLLRDESITCLVVGEFYDRKDEYIAEIDKLGLGDSVRLLDDYVPNEQVEQYFAAADVVVLPYRSSTQSGVVPVAWRFERPVIATSVGGLPEAVEDGRTGLLVPPGDPAALAEAVLTYYRESLERPFTEAIRGNRDRFSWDRVIEAIEKLGASL